VLPERSRLRRAEDFRAVLRSGRRAGRPRLVVHVLVPVSVAEEPPRVGLVVSKAVGGSVVRHQVQRRLRHLARDRLFRLPPGALLVIRALPAAAAADSAALGADLDSALDRLRLTPESSS